MRKAGAPRNSRELAVRNQFFTPRYVVEFLTDNTLARIWYEIRRGETRLKERCRYLVRRHTEIFLQPGQEPPQARRSAGELAHEELLRLPTYVRFRPKKDPRDLKVLDPACGSGHFLLYAFDLLEIIYEEAWGDENSPVSESSGNTLRQDYSDLDALRRNLPSLILRYNLYGIEIDPRCCQIGALALWLRAQRSYQKLGLKAGERLRITRSNIVCAEPMPSENQLLDEFLRDLKPPLLAQLVRTVFEKMKLAGEAGPLLRVEDEIRGAIAEAKKQWSEAPAPEQLFLLPETDKRKAEQLALFDVSGISDEAFWGQVEGRVIDALGEYAGKAANGRWYRRRLFAEDAAQGFAFIDICRARFDAVLMNPPFGEPTPGTQSLLFLEKYSNCGRNLFAAFVRLGLELCAPSGLVGTITSSTGLFYSSFESWRRAYLLSTGRLYALADLGGHVLDSATVKTAAYCLAKGESFTSATCFRVAEARNRSEALHAAIAACARTGERDPQALYEVDLQELSSLPGSTLAYWVPASILEAFRRHPRVENGFAVVARGNDTGDNDRFLRLWWEVPDTARVFDWIPYAKGGEFAPYYSDIPLVVRWTANGREIRSHSGSYLRNETLQGRPGLTYPLRAAMPMNASCLPAGTIFAGMSPGIFPGQLTNWELLTLYNASLVRYLIGLSLGGARTEAGTSANAYHVGVLQKIPIPMGVSRHLAKVPVSEIVELKRELDHRDETSRIAYSPFVHAGSATSSFPEAKREWWQRLRCKMERYVREADETVDDAYGLSAQEREAIHSSYDLPSLDQQLSNQHPWSEVEAYSALISWCVGVAFGRWDVRYALVHEVRSPGPFEPMPVCPPGTLVGTNGFGANANGISTEDWIRARRDANTIPISSDFASSSALQPAYPAKVAWKGILVDDSEHSENIAARVRQVFELIFGTQDGEMESKAGEALRVPDIADYLRRSDRFFAKHLSQYSKFRRQAPIYWPLSTFSGAYTLWIYYHKLSSQLLYQAVNDYVDPKITNIERRLKQVESDLGAASGREATKLRGEVERSRSLFEELQDLKAELLRVAALPYQPNLDDGVLIAACPLWKLFRLPKWRKDLQECWKKLEAGDYDWAHLAYAIWPERVRQKCMTDESLAIAHGLEDLCEIRNTGSSPKRRRPRGGKASESTQMNVEENGD
jgi:hypothetical protein